jgi:hypothetical protein
MSTAERFGLSMTSCSNCARANGASDRTRQQGTRTRQAQGAR